MASPWRIHTLVFDLDDTLFAEHEFVRSGFRAVDAWLARHRNLTGFAVRADALFARGQRQKIFDEGLATLGVAAEPDLIRQMVEIYRGHVPALSLLPDAREILDWAAPRYRLGLISDGFQVAQQRKVDALRIAARFQPLILTDALGREYWKPHPEAFRRVMAQHPGAANGYAYVADNPRKDFLAPRALGWKTVRIRRPGGEYHGLEALPGEAADIEIDSLVRLREFLGGPS